MYDIVEANLVEAGTRQKTGYDTTAKQRPTFLVGDAVWLSKNRSSKLDYSWEGGWTVKTMFRNKSVVEIKSTDGRIRVVHMNRLRLNKIRPRSSSDQVQPMPNLTWEAPSFQHELLETNDAHSEQPIRRTARNRRPPERYGFSSQC